MVTIYFGLSRRNPSTGLLLGMVIGLLRDSLSAVPLGLYGIAGTIIGYFASSIGARLDTEHPAARFALTAAFFVAHQGLIVVTRRILLAQPGPWLNTHLFIAALCNALVPCSFFCCLTVCARTNRWRDSCLRMAVARVPAFFIGREETV